MNIATPGQLPGHTSARSHTIAELMFLMLGRWFDFLVWIGIDGSFLGKRAGPCPICGGGHDRWLWDNKGNRGTFFCRNESPQSGDGLELTKRFLRIDTKKALDLVRSYLGISNGQISKPLPPARDTEESTESISADAARYLNNIEKRWSEGQPIIKESPPHRYLTHCRGLALPAVSNQLRFHPRCEYWCKRAGEWESLGFYPAMLARLETTKGELGNVHHTYLTKYGIKASHQLDHACQALMAKRGIDKPEKYEAPSAKKLMKSSGLRHITGGAIKLFPVGKCLGIAEGIETALACHQATNIPTWAAYSAVSLENVIVPASVKEVIIFADNDSNKERRGQTASARLAQRLTSEGIKVKILTPPEPDTDWADVVTGGPR